MKNFWGREARTSLLRARSKNTAPIAVFVAIVFSCLASVALAQPANDNFANAFVISGSFGTTNGTNLGATLQSGEPNPVTITDYRDFNFYGGSAVVTNSVWFQWTATTNGYVTFSTVGSVDESGNAMATVLAAWTGSSVSSLTPVAADADIEDDVNNDIFPLLATNDPNSTITFFATSGVTYSISVDVNLDAESVLGVQGLPGNYVLSWNASQPTNDIFTNAIVLTNLLGSVSGSNINAVDSPHTTNQVFITNLDDVNYGSKIDVSNSVWYAWKATQTGLATFNTIGSTDLISSPMDTVLAVWTGKSVSNLTLVASDDDAFDDWDTYFDYPNSTVTFPVIAGTNYYFSVYLDADDGGYPGNYVVNWNANIPLNTNFANATLLSGTSGSIADTNLNSAQQLQVNTADSGPIVAQNCLLYQWTPSQNGNVTFNTTNSVDQLGNQMDTVLAIYTGNSLATANLVAANDDDGTNLTSTLTFYASANVTYYIIVGVSQNSGLGGNVALNWSEEPPGAPVPGTFQFTSASYQFSQTEGNSSPFGIAIVHVNMGEAPARATITRIAGADGMADVSYYLTNTWYTNWSVTVTIDVNTQMFILTTNGVFVEATNIITATNSLLTAYQNFNTAQNFFYTTTTNYGYALTNLFSLSPTYGITNPFIASAFSTNNQPPTIPIPFIPPAAFPITETNYSTNILNANGTWLSTNVTAFSGTMPVPPPVTNSNGTVTYTTNFYTYTILIVSNTVSSYLGNDLDFPSGTQTAVFNDFQMNNDIYLVSPGVYINQNLANPLVQMVMTGASLDPLEDPSLPTPQVSSTRNTAYISFANPYAINMQGNPAVYGLSAITNNVFNFSASTIRCEKTVNGSTVAYVGVTCTSHGDNNAATCYYLIDYANASDNLNSFPLQAGSDYARPDNAARYIAATDFTSSTVAPGQLNFPAHNANGSFIQYIGPIPITQDSTCKFNQDIRIQLYYPVGVTPQGMDGYIGAINSVNLTILLTTPPAGAVDTHYMAENSTVGNDPDVADPGANGPVNAIVVQPDGNAIIGGGFTSFTAVGNGQQNYICRLDGTGALDPTFNTGGADGGFQGGFGGEVPVVNALTLDTNENVVVGGNFTAFNGKSAGGIARLTPAGALDPAFNNYGTGANSNVWAVAIQTNGQILIAGDFTSYNGTNAPYLARLNTDGSLDTTFNPGLAPNASVYSMYLQTNGAIVIGGAFTQLGNQNFNYLARLNSDGSLDNTFSNLYTGPNSIVRAVAVQTNGLILAGGEFTSVDGDTGLNYLARFNPDGSPDTNFNAGYGPNDTVWTIALQNDGTFYIGGYFTSVNQTRRVSIARMLANGWVDTSFMDTAYNQFAGLVNPYYTDDPLYDNGENQPNPVYAVAIEPVTPPNAQSQTYDVLVGGLFNEVGGDGGLPDPRFTTSYNREAAPHPRENVARLIGGSTPGPGNIQFTQTSYTGNNISTNQFIQLQRLDGNLGPAVATFEPVQEGTSAGYAQLGVDYTASSSNPVWGSSWGTGGPSTWMLEDGLSGVNNSEVSINNTLYANPIYVDVISNNYPGSVGLGLQLIDPKNQDIFFLGGNSSAQASSSGFGNPATAEGENIPLGVALGLSSVPMSINHLTGNAGVLSLTATYDYAAENVGLYAITVTRTGGSDGIVRVNFKTSNGTALAGTDYMATNGTLIFGQGATTANILVPIINYHTNQTDRIFNIAILTPSGGATLGAITNAQVEIVNDNIASGFAEFIGGVSATNTTMSYGVNENAGLAQLSVARLGGSSGILQVTVATANGTASAGTNYVGVSTNLVWVNNDTNVLKTVNIPILDSGVVSSNLTVKVTLSNATWSNGNSTNLLGVYTNALLTITNTDSSGVAEFTAPSYSVNENAGYAIIPIARAGGNAGTLSVHFFTLDGTATSDINYQSVSNTVVFGPGQVSTNFIVGISNLNSPTDLNFYVVLSNAVPTNALGIPNLAEVTINGNTANYEPPGQPDPTFSGSFNGPILAMALQTNGQILAGGSFSEADGLPRQYMARLNTDGSLDTTFLSYLSTSGANAPVDAIAIESSGLILVGGEFTTFDNASKNFIARLNSNGSVDTGFNPGSGANNNVDVLAQTFVAGTSRIIVGGAFTAFNSTPVNSIVQLLDNGSVDSSFSASANATVYAVAVQPNGQILIGGDFTNVNGVAVNHIARLNVNGSIDFGFTNALTSTQSGAGASVHSIAIQLDGRILIGGNFTNVDGVPCNYIARLNQNGSLDTSFTNALTNPVIGANGPVSTIAVQPDTRIIVGGSFTEFNGVTRNRITRLNPTGATDPTINFGTGADGFVAASLVQGDGNIVLGGGFLNYNSQSHPYVVRIFGGSLAGSGSFEFSAANYQVTETGTIAPITIIRNGGTSGTNSDGSGSVYVNFETLTNGSTAVAGVNYLALSTNIAFPAGEVVETVNIPIFNDVVISPSSWTLNLLLTNPAPASVVSVAGQSTAQLTILNTTAFISFAANNYSVVNNIANEEANISLVLQGYTNTTSSVVFSTTGGSAVPGVEYLPVPPTIVTFNPGQTNVVVQVPIIDDTNYTGNQTVTMALTNSVNAYLVPPTNATLNIIDNVNAPGQLYFASSNYAANLSSGQAVVTLLYTNGNAPVSVSYFTVPGTAVPYINYQPVSGTLNFGGASEITAQPITIPIQNVGPQGPVSFSIVLSNILGGATLIPPTNTVVTIVDDLNSGVAFANATNYEEENAGTISVPVLRLGNPTNAFTVNFMTTNGTALAGVNYVSNSGTLHFVSGQTQSGVSVNLLNNEDASNLTFGILLSQPSSNIQLVAPSNTVVVETPAAAGITLTSPTNSVLKNGGSIAVPVICLDPSNEPPILNSNSVPLSVNFSTANVTAQAGVDYTATNGTLIFTNGIVTNTIYVPILNNSLITGQRTFTVNLTSPQPVPPAKLIAPTNQLITIIDANSGLSFSSPNYYVNGGGLVPVTVIRVDNTNTQSTVSFSTVGGGSAVPNTDYQPTNGTLIFQPGQTSATFAVNVFGSSMVQPNKTVILELFNPTNGVLTAPSVATLNIYNQNGGDIVPVGVSLAKTNGAPNGILQSNQMVYLWFGFRDAGGLNVTNLYAKLLPSANIAPTNIISGGTNETESYGPLTVNGPSASQEFTLTPFGTNGQTILATFALQAITVNNTTNYETNAFALTIGSWTTTFYNTNAIFIPPAPGINQLSIASPYPSAITVSNVGGVLIGSSVTLTNFTITSPQGVGVLVVSPQERDTLLMSDVGSANVGINKVTLIFSDSATNSLPSTTTTAMPITNGVYKPTQDGPIPNFP